jgi:hypothetical protein
MEKMLSETFGREGEVLGSSDLRNLVWLRF